MTTLAIPGYSEPAHTGSQVRKTILVVEDETFVCDVICDVLKNYGYRVLRADSAGVAKAMFCCYGQEIDLLLCDAILPDENGISLAHTLRQVAPNLKLIISSGYPPSELDQPYQEDPGAQYLTKPYSTTSLIAKVKYLLAESSSGDVE